MLMSVMVGVGSRTWLMLATVATLVLLPAPAIESAVVLNPVSFQEFIGFAGTLATGTNDAVSEHVVLSLDLPGVGFMQGFAHTGGGLSPRAEIDYTIVFGTPSASAVADAMIRYEFAAEQMEGDPFGGLVPVIISTAGSASLSLPEFGTAFARLTHPGGQFDACAIGSGGCSLPPPSFDETVTVMVPANTAQTIDMRARGVNGVGLPPGGSISLHAVVDPRIEIDPTFPLRDQFRLVFSPGLCPDPTCSAVPEPPTAVLVGSALVALGVAGLIRRGR